MGDFGDVFSKSDVGFGGKSKDGVLSCNDWARQARQNFASNAQVGQKNRKKFAKIGKNS